MKPLSGGEYTGRLGSCPMEEFMANLNPKKCISDHRPCFEFVDLLLQALVLLFEVGYVFRLDVLVLLQVVHLRVLLLTAISCIFPVLESSPALLEFLDDFFAESPLLQLPVEVFDVEGRQLIIRHHVTVLPTLRINKAESWVHLFLW